MSLLATNRLVLREVTPDDAAFILELINQPSFHRFIGDRGVRTLEAARQYIIDRMLSSYQTYGFGMYAVLLKDSSVPMGVCGLVKRDALDDVDIGFAFLPQYEGHGYAYESASAVLGYARTTLRIQRVCAITALDNVRSMKLLEKLGLTFRKLMQLPGESSQVRFFLSEG